MEALTIWETIGLFLSVASVLIGPTIWFYRNSITSLERENKSVLSKLEENNKVAFKSFRDDLKEHRHHFDAKFSEIYTTVDSKNRELRDVITKDLDYIRNHIVNVETKIEDTRERNHGVEKELLRLQVKIGKDYITKEELQEVLRLRNVSQ